MKKENTGNRKAARVYKVTTCMVWGIILLFVIDLAMVCNDITPADGIFAALITLALIALPFAAFAEEKADKKKNPEKYRLKAEKLQAEKDRLRAEQAARREELQRKEAKHRYENSIVEVKIIGGGSTVNKTHGLGGAIVGGALFGVPGAIVGSVIPKGSEQKVRFAVKYGSGKVVIQEHHPNSWEYKELIKYVKWEDLK